MHMTGEKHLSRETVISKQRLDGEWVALVVIGLSLAITALAVSACVLWTRTAIALDVRLRTDVCGDITTRIPDPSKTQSQHELRCILAEHARAIYCVQCLRHMWPAGCKVSTLAEGTAMVVRYASGACVVAFRGTQSIQDVIINLDTQTAPNPYGGGRVHAGFLDRYLSLRPRIIEALGPDRECAPLYVTGHSLGGAVATICALDLKPNLSVVLGAPKVGDATYAALQLSDPIPLTIVVNIFDPVWTLPTRGPFFVPMERISFAAIDKGCWAANHSVATYLQILRTQEARVTSTHDTHTSMSTASVRVDNISPARH